VLPWHANGWPYKVGGSHKVMMLRILKEKPWQLPFSWKLQVESQQTGYLVPFRTVASDESFHFQGVNIFFLLFLSFPATSPLR